LIFLLILLFFIGYGIVLYRKKDFSTVPFLLVLSLILIAGLRKNYGYDYINYLTNWNELYQFSDVMHSSFDKGYTLLALCFKKFHFGFHSFMLCISLVSIGLKYKFIKKLSPLPFISFLIYYLLFFIINDMEQIRHGLAIGLCLYAIIYIIEEKPIKYTICCLAAFLLHSSAFLFFPLYFFRKINLNLKKCGIILIGSLLFSQINFMSILEWVNTILIHSPRIAEKILLYKDQNVGGILSLTFLLRVFVFLLYYIVVYRIHPDEIKTKVVLNGYFYGIFIFLFLNSVSILAVRSSAILRCLEIIMIAEILNTTFENKVKPLQWISLLRKKGMEQCVSSSSVYYKIIDKCTNVTLVSYISVAFLFVYYFYKFVSLLFVDGYFSYFSI